MDAPLLPALPGYDNPTLIAHGTTALVFRATQTKLNRLVAIKVITADTGSVPVNAARELATTVSLSSQPHIVSIIDTGTTDDDRPYIVMEYCEGGSYAGIMRRDGPLPVDDVVEVGIKIGEALHAAHQAGIVHRDVKPSNVLRSRFGPALTDFGIARAPDELSGTLTREMMTPHHASPEALLHQAQSGLSDVYSLSSTMWTLLVGHPPFVDPAKPPPDMYAFRDQVLHDPVPPMTRDDVPYWLVAELTKAMAKLPVDRHASALDFAESVRRGSLGLATSAAPISGPPSAPYQQGRAPVPVTGLPVETYPLSEPYTGVTSAEPVYVPPPRSEPRSEPRSNPAPRLEPVPGPRSGPEARPSLHPQEPSAPEGTNDGGWLGSSAPARSLPQDEVATARQRHFADSDLRPTSGRRNGLVILLVTIAVLGVAAGAALVLTARSNQPTAAVTTTPATGSPGGIGEPREVKVVRSGTSVTVSWTDAGQGATQFLVAGTGPGNEKLDAVNVPARVTSHTFDHLDAAKRYCFVVAAFYTVNRIPPAKAVCTP